MPCMVTIDTRCAPSAGIAFRHKSGEAGSATRVAAQELFPVANDASSMRAQPFTALPRSIPSLKLPVDEAVD